MKKLKNETGIRKISLNDFDHMQAAYFEGFNSMGKAFSNIAEPVILHGCTVVKVSTTYTVSSGAIYYGGEIYQVPAHVVTLTSTPQWAIIEEFDPSNQNPPTVNYIGGSPRAAHVQNLIRLSNSAGLCDYNLIRQIDHVLFNKLNKPGDVVMQATATTDFDGTGLGKTYTRWEGWALMNGANGTIDMGGFFPVGLKNSVADYDTIGDTGGAASVTLTSDQSGLREHQHSTNSNTAGGAGFAFVEATVGLVQRFFSGILKVDGVANRDGAQDALESHENRPPFKTLRFIQKIA